MIVGQNKMPLEEAVIHFGAKGMKWGVRKSKPTGSGKSAIKKTKTEIEESERRKKIAIGAARAAIILAVLGGRIFIKATTGVSVPAPTTYAL